MSAAEYSVSTVEDGSMPSSLSLWLLLTLSSLSYDDDDDDDDDDDEHNEEDVAIA